MIYLLKKLFNRRLFFLFLFTLIRMAYPLKVLSENNIDSLKLVVENTKSTDTNYINACLDLAWEYMYTFADSAEIFAQKAVDASGKIRNDLYLTNSYNTLGVTCIVRADYARALSVLNQALKIAEGLLKRSPHNEIYIKRVVVTSVNMANVKYWQSKYSEAIEYYLQALDLAEKIGYVSAQANCLSNINAAYKDLGNYDKAFEYGYKSLTLAEKTDNSFWLSQSLNNLGAIFFSVQNYDSAKYYFEASMRIFEKDNDEFSLIESYGNMGSVFRDMNNVDSALSYFDKALQLSRKLNYPEGLTNTHYMIGQLYDSVGEYDQAVSHYKKSLASAERTGSSKFLMTVNQALAGLYEKTGNYKKAYDHFKTSRKYYDTIFSEEHDKSITELETKYQTREKEERIKLLTEQNALEKAEAKNRQIIFISVIVILILLLIAIMMAYRSYKHRQIAEKSLMRQHSEKQVLNAVIKTEFEERTRFAEELHDAMGALLSTLKLYVNELGDKNNNEHEQKEMLKQANALLDEAVDNARTISHNIMPASIRENGLIYSLRSFIDKINSSGKITINFSTDGLRERYEWLLELALYRMLTEMINNTLKHASASIVEIDLMEKNNSLVISYVDNGKGFDYDSMINSGEGGLGLKNILNRIRLIGGKHDIKSKKGEGFSATIEVEV